MKVYLVREGNECILLVLNFCIYMFFLKRMLKTTTQFLEEEFSGTECTKSKRKKSPSYRIQFKASLFKQFICTGLKLCFIFLMSMLKGKSVPASKHYAMKACNGSAGKIPLAFLCSALVAGE
jgi:hypothetical protein